MQWGVETVASSCPYCGEPVELLIDCSAGPQRYVEDCQVCCRPMVLIIASTDPVELTLQDEDQV